MPTPTGGSIIALVLSFAASAVALGSYPLSNNHYLWGESGKPSGFSRIARQAVASTTKIVPVPQNTAYAPVDLNCTNGPSSRRCWKDGFNLDTDFDLRWPAVGKTVRYTLEITNTTCDPDGSHRRPCFLINNQYPGPTIQADWGDTLSVTIKNSLPHNGTSIHWHGVRQLGTNTQDGVNGLTECPFAPGDTVTYTFKVTQYGTSWYHSHYSNQYGDGIVGGLIFNGPATANYDIDFGTYLVSDWTYPTAFTRGEVINEGLQNGKPPPPSDTILINGTNKSPTGEGAYSNVTLTPGKKHRLRLVNTSVDNSIRVSLDNHTFQVISTDFVPVVPYNTEWVLLGAGQRTDVIITANQTASSYYFRAEAASNCVAINNFYGRAIFTYDGVTPTTPLNTTFPIPTGNCTNNLNELVPWWETFVPSEPFYSQASSLNVAVGSDGVHTNGKNLVYFGVNMSGIDVMWSKPTLQYVLEGNTSYPRVFNLIELPKEHIWTYWIIQETPGVPPAIPHPIHLHGHDFFILGQGFGLFNRTTDTPNLIFHNPPRRDVAFLLAGGWMVIAFETDNPGAWLLHCHIAWHISEGLGVQFLESKDTIDLPSQAWQDTCTRWNRYYNNDPLYLQDDSGL